jgi:hypothetical protein
VKGTVFWVVTLRSAEKAQRFSVLLCFIPVSCFVYSTILNMEELCSSETSGCLRTTLGFNPKDHVLLISVAVVRKRTIPTERPQLVGEVSAKLCW